jgi:hypothetical protein
VIAAEEAHIDPDASLAEQRALATAILERQDADMTDHRPDAERLTQLVLALDGWLGGHGFLPARWRRAEPRARWSP